MLAYLDTLIGFSVIMLVISLLITILTQMMSSLMSHRGANLLWGLKTLFAQFDPKKYEHICANAESLARQVLTHPLVSDSWFSENRVAKWFAKVPVLAALFARFELASAIRVNELTDVLSHLASNALAGQPVGADINKLLGAVQAATAAPGVPAGVTASVQTAVTAARTDLDELQNWFGSFMDRVSQKFAMYMRIWTVAFAVIFAFGTGLNTNTLLGDLYRNSDLRNGLVSAAQPVSAGAQQVAATNPADRNAVQTETQNAKDVSAAAAQAGFQILAWRWPAGFPDRASALKYLLGVLMTAALLSLGAPFWFNALKSMTNLRPIVASKETSETAQS